ncbi:MAG: ribose-5-phosphate isomerase A, partial [Candidatus Thermoplasmatota archaeon]|nr:ribose-5-phosphate isomerase A [Candidatus Thermoplasmatota archaeon]
SHHTTMRAIASLLDCDVTMREVDGALLVTDNGNHIADAHTGATLTNPVQTEADLLALAGVVQVGLFNDMCDVVVMASSDGITVLTKND